MVRSLTGMHSQVRFEISFLKECFSTLFNWADIVANSIVPLDVDIELVYFNIRFCTIFNGTCERFYVVVSPDMIL